MDPVVTGSLISAGANLLGGLFGKEAQEDSNALAREAAQMGIRWKVEDAKAAGLHPLFALAGSGATYNPAPATAFAESMRSAGQDLGRAAQAAMTPAENEARDLQTELLKSQIAESDARRGLLESQTARNYQQAGTAIGGSLMGSADAFPVSSRSLPIERALEPFVSGSPRERAVARLSSGTLSAAPEVQSQVLRSAPSNPGVAYGPGDPLGKFFTLPFSVEVPTEYGYMEWFPRVYLPSSKDPGSAEAVESLEGAMTGGAFAAINAHLMGADIWQLVKDKYSRLRSYEREMIRERARRWQAGQGARQLRDPIRDYPYPNRR